MSEQPAVSVVVPVYKIPDDYLRECLDSLVNQTLKNIQIILVDDGSPMPSNAQICDEYAAVHDNLEVIHKENEGVSVARNVGIDAAKGEWISFVDPDDWADETMFEQLLKAAQNSETQPDIVVCDTWVEMSNRTATNAFYSSGEQWQWNAETQTRTLLQVFGRNRYYNPPQIAIGVPWARIFRTSFIKEKDLRFEKDLRRMQDNVFSQYAFAQADVVVYSPKCLYHYRKFEQSTSNKYSPKAVEDFEKVYRSTQKFLSWYQSDDERLEQGYYAKVVQGVQACFKFYYFHEQNPLSGRQKHAEIRALLSKDPYKTALQRIKRGKVDSSVYLVALLLKMHWYSGIGMATRVVRRIKKTQQ